jgi:GT2 family glycosyltransferase
MHYAVVIPSRNLKNLEPCIAAIRENEPHLQLQYVFVVDDDEAGSIKKYCESNGITRVEGAKPFIYARNANLGLTQAFKVTDRVILMNDDALLQSRGGFTVLSHRSFANHEYGILSAATNSAGNVNMFPCGSDGIRREKITICFICCLIHKRVWNKVGPLDEAYCVDYGVEDGDYCYRTRAAGFKLGIVDRCYVDHTTLKSTYRGNGHRSYEGNKQVFEEKWGFPYESR